MKKANLYYLATTAAVLLWSASYIATKYAYSCFSPLMAGLVRFFFATLLLLAVRVITKDTVRPCKKDMVKIALSGLLGITLYFAAENIGVKLTSASNCSLLIASYPAITALFEFFVYRTKPTLRKVIGITLAFGGVLILTSQTGSGGKETFWGNLILIAAGVIWTFYNFITRTVTGKYSPVTLSYYQFLFGTIFFVPLVLIEHQPIAAITGTGIAAMIYLFLGCSVGAFLLYNWGLRKLSAAASVSLMNLVPVFGIVLSALLLKETITMTQILGGAVVILGVILSTTTDRKVKDGTHIYIQSK